MSIQDYISTQAPERQHILSQIHSAIIKKDRTVEAGVESMMRAEMIVFKAGGVFKYGLASGKKHMTLHLLPMYTVPAIFAKYEKLLSKAKFQKGCINFSSEEEMPLKIVEKLIADCSKVDLHVEREKYLKSQKLKKRP